MIRHRYADDCEDDSAASMIPVHDEYEFDSYTNDGNLDMNWLDAFLTIIMWRRRNSTMNS